MSMPFARLRRCRPWMNCAANSSASFRRRRRSSRSSQRRRPRSSRACLRPMAEKTPPDVFIVTDFNKPFDCNRKTQSKEVKMANLEKIVEDLVEPHRARSRRTRQAFGSQMGCVRGRGGRRRGRDPRRVARRLRLRRSKPNSLSSSRRSVTRKSKSSRKCAR